MNSVRIYLKYSVPLEEDRTRQSFPHECTQKYHRRRTGQAKHLPYIHLRNYQGKGYLLHWQFQLRFGMLLANPPLYTANYKQITVTDPQMQKIYKQILFLGQQKKYFLTKSIYLSPKKRKGRIFIFFKFVNMNFSSKYN